MDEDSPDCTDGLHLNRHVLPVQSISHMLDGESLSSLTEQVHRWAKDGQPIFNDLLSALHESPIELEPMIDTFIFAVVGGYTYRLSTAIEAGDDIISAHHHAITALMQNPKITQMVEDFMQNQVAAHIETVVD